MILGEFFNEPSVSINPYAWSTSSKDTFPSQLPSKRNWKTLLSTRSAPIESTKSLVETDMSSWSILPSNVFVNFWNSLLIHIFLNPSSMNLFCNSSGACAHKMFEIDNKSNINLSLAKVSKESFCRSKFAFELFLRTFWRVKSSASSLAISIWSPGAKRERLNQPGCSKRDKHLPLVLP